LTALAAHSGDAAMPAGPAAPGFATVRLLGSMMIGLAVFLGGFVIFEPAPYELFLAGLFAIWLIGGMRLSREIAPLLVLFTLFNFGGVLSTFMIDDLRRGFMYVAVSYFLALTSVFFAIVILEDMGRLRLIFRLYVVSALVTSMLGIIGYFDIIPGFGMFTRYQRAMGAFQDPNVYSPFLAAPILYLVYGILNRSASLLALRAGALMILLLGLFLAFSRAGWGLAVLSIALFYFLLLVNEKSAGKRTKYILLAAGGFVAVVLLIVVALQFDQVSRLFAERAQVVQDYDGGRMGRFARHIEGFELAFSKPLGVGPLEFGYIFAEDTHNILLKALMDYGWLGFLSWMIIVAWTLAGSFKLLFRPRPWQPYLQIAWVVFLGHNIIGMVIDIDHWRHFYLMIGIIWGCMALEARHGGGYRSPAALRPARQSANTHGKTPARRPVPSLAGQFQ
jgi:O-antigen ligase